jgi:hypothetical protein
MGHSDTSGMTQIARRTDGTFAPGTSGNPSGQSKALREVVQLAREHTATAINTLVEICEDPKAQAMARVHAAKALLDRSWGQSALETDFARIGDDDDEPVSFTFRLGPNEIEGELVDED